MAGQALPERQNETAPVEVHVDRDMVREAAAKLYGAGLERPKIARAMVDLLVPNGRDRPLEQRLSQARNKLRKWEGDQKFRDLVYELATIKLDMATPSIFKALVKSAKKGRVDATRLVLELTGRHNPKGETAPAQVIVAINGIPRPTGSPHQAVAADAQLLEAGEVEV